MPSPQGVVDDTEADGAADAQPLSWTVNRVIVVVVVLVMVGFWAWIFAGGPKKLNPDRLQDRAFVERTERRCQTLRTDLAALPNAADITSADERADVLDDANVLVTDMVDAIEADAPTTGDAGKSVAGWIEDWRTYLANREDYADRLRQDPGAQLLLDESPLGDSVDKPIEVFADVNDMPDCATPGDVG